MANRVISQKLEEMTETGRAVKIAARHIFGVKDEDSADG